MTSVVNLQPSPYSFLGGLKVTFIAALGTLLRMPTLYVGLRHRISSWPASSSQPRVPQCASALESVIYGTQHTTSGYPLNRKSVSCPRAYRAFLVTRHHSNVPTGLRPLCRPCFLIGSLYMPTMNYSCLYLTELRPIEKCVNLQHFVTERVTRTNTKPHIAN